MLPRRAVPLATLLPLLAASVLAGSGVVEVAAAVAWPVAPPGWPQEGTCEVRNVSDHPVQAQARASVTYADGAEDDVLGLGQPVLLGPGASVRHVARFPVAADAAPGVATFLCVGRAVGHHGGVDEASAAAPFLVVA